MNRRGQASIEVAFLIPIFTILLGGAISAIYIGWQSLKVQEAANIAARIQGQERVAGGKDIGSIRRANGQDDAGDDVFANNVSVGRMGSPNRSSVYGRLYSVVKDTIFKGDASNVRVPKPYIGQNIDEVSVVRYIKLPKVPFLERGEGKENIKLTAYAWGGEDTMMHALPRWGEVGDGGSLSGSRSGKEWQNIMERANTSSDE